MTKKGIIYIAGPIDGVVDYQETFKQYEDWLKERGYTVINPTTVLPKGLSRVQYMHTCLSLIDCADAVLFMPGSFDSRGAQCEYGYCRYIGKPCAFSVYDLEVLK